MKLTKNDFTFHRLIGNKYYEQTYLAYLGRGNKKFRYIYVYGGWNQNAEYVKLFIIITYDFVIRCNNIIRRRGTKESNINDLKDLFFKSFKLENDNAWCPKQSIDKFYDEEEVLDNPTKEKFHKILFELTQWKYKFETDFDGFKEYIYNLVLDFDSNHYSWIVGDNIVYNRSIRDNADKKYYCYLSSEKGIEKFKKIYLKNVYLEDGKELLIEQISDLLVSLTDIYNLVVSKMFDSALDLLTDYLEDNKEMKLCKDIYYSKIFVDMEKLVELLKKKKYQDVLSHIKKIIINENKKYNNEDFSLIENISIVEDEIEFGQYFEL